MRTISEKYLEQQKELHKNPNYGVASVSYAPLVTQLITQLGVTELLDYGCGKGRLAESIKPEHEMVMELYDPSIEKYSERPSPREMVCCIDVLEHIEPELLDNVLDDLKSLTKKYGFFTIHTGPAVKVLPDGRNAHLIQEDFRWWLPKLWERFNIHSMSHTPGGFYVVVTNGTR